MKTWAVATISLFLGSFLMPRLTIGQDNRDDSLFYKSAINQTIAYYHSAIKEQNGIYNGRMNVPYRFLFEKGIPFFETEKFINGDVVYDGLLYTNEPLLFDQLSDFLITLVPQGRLQLINEKIERFTISGHQFFRLVNDSINNINTGFYEQLYNGNSEVLLKVKKAVREDLMSGIGVVRYIDHKEYYFVKKGNRYFPARSKKDILEIFSLHKKELQQLVKKNKLNFQKDIANSIIQVAGYYDQLTR